MDQSNPQESNPQGHASAPANFALACVKQFGWRVFPCQPNGKAPATKQGFKDATLASEGDVQTWPEMANYGIPTGQTNGITIIDIDGPEGWTSLKDLSTLLGFDLSTYTLTLSTPSGGAHLYFAYHPDLPQVVKVMPGIDTRNDGGYVVGLGSQIDGNTYDIRTNEEIKPIPSRLVEIIKESHGQSRMSQQSLAPQDSGASQGLLVPEGGRNNYLTALAGAMRRRGMGEEAILAALRAENMQRLAVPLDEEEVMRIARSVGRYTPGADALYGAMASQYSQEQGPTVDGGRLVRVDAFIGAAIAYMKDKDKVKGQPTGLDGLDRLLGGGRRLGEVTCWHAEAKTGKNTLWHYLMYIGLELGIPQAYASRELSPETEVVPNLLSVHYKENAWLAEMDEARSLRYSEPLATWPLYFSDGYGYFPLDSIITWVTQAKAAGIRYFWFDHLHYMLEDPEDHKSASKLIKELKTLAKREDIHIDIIIQPNKLMDGQKLSLNSIKGGAAMGQAIDNLLILERVKQEGVTNISKLTLEVGRSKLCKPGHLYLQFDPSTCRFVETEAETVEAKPQEDMAGRPHVYRPPQGLGHNPDAEPVDMARQWMRERFTKRAEP